VKPLYGSSKRRPGTTFERVKATQLGGGPEVIGTINGMPVGSSWEWHTAQGLWMLKWRFDYQVPINGGREVRGGQVLDFVVYTNPNPSIIYVNGEYWHNDPDMELMAQAQAAQAMTGAKIIVMGRSESVTRDDAYRYLLKEIGRA